MNSRLGSNRAWQEDLGETLLLAAEQHDIGWLDWETEPTFNRSFLRSLANAQTPHLLRKAPALGCQHALHG